jgi:hypothetical protein
MNYSLKQTRNELAEISHKRLTAFNKGNNILLEKNKIMQEQLGIERKQLQLEEEKIAIEKDYSQSETEMNDFKILCDAGGQSMSSR